MYRTREQTLYAGQLKGLTDTDLFEKMRTVWAGLKIGSRFLGPDQDLLWQSLALEAEIIDRFPKERLETFREWLKQRVN